MSKQHTHPQSSFSTISTTVSFTHFFLFCIFSCTFSKKILCIPKNLSSTISCPFGLFVAKARKAELSQPCVVLLSDVTSRVSRVGRRKGEPNGSHALKQQFDWQDNKLKFKQGHKQTRITCLETTIHLTKQQIHYKQANKQTNMDHMPWNNNSTDKATNSSTNNVKETNKDHKQTNKQTRVTCFETTIHLTRITNKERLRQLGLLRFGNKQTKRPGSGRKEDILEYFWGGKCRGK